MAQLAARLAPFGSAPLPMESSPTMVIAADAYEALALEKGASSAVDDTDQTLPRGVIAKSPSQGGAQVPQVAAGAGPNEAITARGGADSAVAESIGKVRERLDTAPSVRKLAELERAHEKKRAARGAWIGLLAGCCLIGGVAIGVRLVKTAAQATAETTPSVPAAPEARLTSAAVPANAAEANVEAPTIELADAPAVTPDDLPSAKNSEPAKAEPATAAPSLPMRLRARVAKGAAARPAAPDPLVRAAATIPISSPPEHKATDEDLRRFLDDRR
jgi:hypothetical protein